MADKEKQKQFEVRKFITADNVTKGIMRQFNEKTGKYETIKVDVPKQTISQQIENTKLEINQSNEISQKLTSQYNTLKEQVRDLKQLVDEKAKQYKKEQEEREKNLLKMIKTKNLEINIATMTEEQVRDRLNELESEYKSAQKINEVLAKEREVAKRENENIEITQNIQQLQIKLDEKKKQLKELKKDNIQLSRQSQTNQKKLDKIEQGLDEAAQINQLNKELCMLREKQTQILEKQSKSEKNITNIKQSIDFYEEKIQNIQDDKVKSLKELFEKVSKKWEEKEKQLDEERTKKNKELLAEKRLKEKQKDQEKEKEKEKDKEKEKEKEKDEEQDKSKKFKRISDYIKEKKDIASLKADEQNFIQLFQLKTDLISQKKKKYKKNEQEKEQLESQINNLKLERVNIQNAIKEREREREMAETKEVEEREKLEILKEKKKTELEQKEKEKLEKAKSNQRSQLSPLRAKQQKDITTKEKLRKEKDEQLQKFIEKHPKLVQEKKQQLLQEPFKLSYQELEEKRKRKQQKQDERDEKDKAEVKSLSIIETVCRTKHRGSKRDWFGFEPNEQTIQCDDVHILGQFSINHRIKRITIYHNPTEGLIYLLWTEYRKEDGSLISGTWNINQEVLEKNKDIKKDELDLKENDKIKQIIIRRDNNFVSFIQFNTKQGQQLKVGKEVIEKQEEEKPKDKTDEQQDKKDGEGTEKKEDPDKRDLKIDNFSVLFTLFSGYSQRNDKELAMSYFGYEIGRKLTAEEYTLYLQEKKQRIEEKEKKYKLKKLEESMASDLNRSQIRKK